MNRCRPPANVNVLGKPYTITYTSSPTEVDCHRREVLWGQIKYEDRTIRIYDNGRTPADLWVTLIHEVLHAIATELNIRPLTDDGGDEIVGLLALALTDVMLRNKWLEVTDASADAV